MQRLLWMAVFISMVVGCSERKHGYHYLVQHPRVLEKEFTQCQSSRVMTEADIKQCDVVNKAVESIRKVISLQRENPEKLGFNVLQAQMDLQDYKTKLEQLQQQDNKMEVMLKEIDALKQAIHKKKSDINMYLSVIGLSSPE